jgi:hypothetical protein
MQESGKQMLVSLLFTEGRKLENLKFFPGTDRGLTAERMCAAAANAFATALAGGLVDNPPTSGRKKASLTDYAAA